MKIGGKDPINLRLNWFEQLKSKYGSISNASQELGIERSSLYKWNICKAPIPLHHIETLIMPSANDLPIIAKPAENNRDGNLSFPLLR